MRYASEVSLPRNDTDSSEVSSLKLRKVRRGAMSSYGSTERAIGCDHKVFSFQLNPKPLAKRSKEVSSRHFQGAFREF
jgi:hypothetical protein